MNLKQFNIRRFLRPEPLKTPLGTITPRAVFGVYKTPEDYYLLLPKSDTAYLMPEDMYDELMSNSREFTADPSALFGVSDVELEQSNSVKAKPATDNASPNKVQSVKPRAVKAKPVKTPPESQETQNIPAVDDSLSDRERSAALEAQDNIKRLSIKHGTMSPIEYTIPNYPGGTEDNYKVRPLAVCGVAGVTVRSLSELRDKIPRLPITETELPPNIMQDLMENVIPGCGLKIELPFKRLYASMSPGDGSFLRTITYAGIRYGLFNIDPNQAVHYLGGFNSLSMAHIFTHELAHFIDSTMIRNVDRMKFQEAIRGKKVHPDSLKASAVTSVPAEHFATLAELMVWGDSVRKVYALNGIEVVEKYFVNRYIPESDINTRKI